MCQRRTRSGMTCIGSHYTIGSFRERVSAWGCDVYAHLCGATPWTASEWRPADTTALLLLSGTSRRRAFHP